ncbi:uncharacterized protein LOC133485929 [Phyllopteryx taeniolatus]|uniref:uncharacterized protein LOC133485929 n=1 Tax=Phyllopteryx taeniolatus TaxID=161469 RepID=UPI002AD36DEC|nr:uncharacterized protein LOC133485929 [Phyllopteryx taeniolatus]
MTSMEKRRSSRKSGGHRKHSDGGFSDTSSGGSFLDETDREVRSLTDKAFRSLCIGDEAVYNDSDLGSSSPCIHRDRQRAFSQSGLEREDSDRNELKKEAHESFSLMVQQYEQDLIHEGMYGAEMNRNPQWDVCGERTQGRVSATFQQSFMEMTQENRSLGEDLFGSFTNGATDLSLQHRRSRSRVSSLIRAFNSQDGAVMEDQLREWNDEAHWNRPGLMNMLSPYQQNFTNGHLPMAGQFPSQDTNLYSTEAAAVSHMNAASSFMRLSHNNHNMMTQLDCNSNFFIHSEFSPFRVWRDHNSCQQADVSRFMHCSEFPKWDQTPMYKELSLEPQIDGIKRHHRTMMAPVVPDHLLQSISTSTRLRKASALEKRCESEQAVHYPHRITTQSLGTNRFPSQRPSMTSPTIEMSQETISSVKALHQQIKIMTEHNTKPEMTAERHGALCSNDTLFAVTTERNVASHSTSILSNDGQLLSPLVPVSQAEPPESTENAVSPQTVEHPPVRAESRGGTPDVRMSSYKSRASSLLFNLKDNRKRVKSTYSPAKFKGFEPLEKSRELPLQESKDIVLDMPEYLQIDIQDSSWTDAPPHQHVKLYYSPRPLSPGINSQPNTGHISDYKTAQRKGETVQISGYIPENYTSNHLTTGQNISEDLSSFPPFKQDVAGIQVGGEAYRHKLSYNTTDMHWPTGENIQISDYLNSKGAHLKEADVRHSTEESQRNPNKQNYSNVSKERFRRPNTPNSKQLALKAVVAPWKQETSPFKEKHQHAQANLQAITIKEISSQRDDHKKESQQNTNQEAKRTPQCNLSVRNPTFYGQDRIENYFQQNMYGNGNKDTDKTMHNQETSQRKVCGASFKEEQPKTAEQRNTYNNHNSSSVPEMEERVHQVKYGQSVAVKAVQNRSKQIQSEQRQMEQSNVQQWQNGTVEAEPARPEKTDETMADKVKLEQAKAKEQRKEQMRGKQKERTNEKPSKAPTQVRDDKETNDVKVQAEQMRGVQTEQVQAEQADLEGLKGKQRQLESVKTQPSQKDKITIDEVKAKPRTIEQEGEQKMLENVKTNNVKSDQTLANQLNMEKAQLQTKTEHASAKMEVHSEKDKQNEKKAEKESQVNAQPKEEIHDAKETNSVARKAELAKMELTNIELAKVVLVKHQHIKERSSKPTEILTIQHHVKSEPSKVERVKTELANAKAELAKIKEKMKGEQTEKVRYTIIPKEEGVANKDGLAEVTVIQQTAQIHQPKDNSAAKIAYNINQEKHGADYYQNLREKYGFINSLSHKMSSETNISLNDDNVTPSALSLDIYTKVNNNKSNDEYPTNSGENNNKKVKFSKGNESLYIYSESSKEFKLSQADHLPPCADKRATGDIVADIGKDDKVTNLETSYPDSRSDDAHLESVRNPERKDKSEHLKVLPHKEKAQTKQEILTSKIKAHAEKEISALMEGFALREVGTSKTVTKPLPARQNLHLKQKPLLHEVLSGHETSISSNTTTKQQTGSSVMEDKALRSSEGMSTQTVNQWQKQLPTEPMKSNDQQRPENAPPEMKKTAGYSVSTEQQPHHHEIRSLITNKDQESKYSKEKLAIKPDENSEKAEIGINYAQT